MHIFKILTSRRFIFFASCDRLTNPSFFSHFFFLYLSECSFSTINHIKWHIHIHTGPTHCSFNAEQQLCAQHNKCKIGHFKWNVASLANKFYAYFSFAFQDNIFFLLFQLLVLCIRIIDTKQNDVDFSCYFDIEILMTFRRSMWDLFKQRWYFLFFKFKKN